MYDKPFSKTDHDAITDNIPVMGEVKNGRVVYAYQEDADRGADIRLKKKK